MQLQNIKTVHVRWPARPAEHRAGPEFSLLLSLFQEATIYELAQKAPT